MSLSELLAIVVGFVTIVWFFWDINRRNGKLQQQALEIQRRALEILQDIAHILDNQTKILAKIEENTRK